MAKRNTRKKVYTVCTVKPDLSYDKEHRMCDEAVSVDEIATLPSRLQSGDKVIVHDIFTTFPTYDFMMSFLGFALRNGITFESECQRYLNFSAARPLPYKITNYLLEMQQLRNQLWNMRSLFGVRNDDSAQAESFYRKCDWIVGRVVSITLSTNGILKR